MGKIFFNPETGEFWESKKRRRKPPDGFVDTGYVKNHTYKPHSYTAVSFYCPVCRKYHCYINVYDWYPLHARMRAELTEKYGCKVANKIVTFAHRLGGRKEHYRHVETLYNMNLLDVAQELLTKLKGRDRRRVLNLLLKGRVRDAEIYTVARSFKP